MEFTGIERYAEQVGEEMVTKSGQLEDLHFITQTDELLVNSLQKQAAVVLQPSQREGVGLTVSEALWRKTPVVATNVGGIPPQIWDGQTGFLVKPGDYALAADRVVRILSEPELRTELGDSGHAHVRCRFLMPRLLLDWVRLAGDLV